MNLNGEWEFAFDDKDEGLTLGWGLGLQLSGRILVPFSYQCLLSGINDKSIHEIIWYARSFRVPSDWGGLNILLHFGAVDYECTVWVNGQEVGHNQGGHTPFHFNIAPYLSPGDNRLTLRVVDSQSPQQPRGKQSISGLPHDIDYFCTSGIWQTVWLEPVHPIRIDELAIEPVLQDSAFDISLFLHAPSSEWKVQVEVLDGERVVTTATKEVFAAATTVRVAIRDAKQWSPDSPFLYRFRIQLFSADILIDEVISYGGLRSCDLRNGRFFLNGEPFYLKMVLDQGYWPDGYLTAPCDDAIRADVESVKQLGFNGVRKHQKIEDPRWLYWCDHLGLLVWEEMPNAREWSTVSEERLASEWARVLRRDYNHPCIMAWVPVNESWGFPGLKENHPAQYAFLERMVALTRRTDCSRAVIDNDGWEHTDITDICAIHDYTPTAELLRERYRERMDGGELPAHVWIDKKPLFVLGSRYRGQPIMLSEVGGFLQIPPDMPAAERDMLFRFYGSWMTPDELIAKYRDLMQGIASLRFVAGFCYTQLYDIEQETNGLLTFGRKPKVNASEIKSINNLLT